MLLSLSYKTKRFRVVMGLYNNSSQKTSNCCKNINDTLSFTWCNLFVNYTIHSENSWMYHYVITPSVNLTWWLTTTYQPTFGKLSLTLYTLTSVCIFSILFSIHFQRGWQGEFVSQSRASLVGDHLVYPHDFYDWFRGDIVRRN